MGSAMPTMGAQSAARVMLVEDHAAFRESLAFMFEREPDFEVVAQAGTVAEAQEKLGGIDLAVIDLGLPDGDGTEMIGPLRSANPSAMVLVLTASFGREVYARAVEAGADGMLDKTVPFQEVVAAARSLVASEPLLSVEEVVDLLRLASRSRKRDRETHRCVERLTPRELEMLRELAGGLSDKEISESLHVGVGTVRNHLASIFGKLGVNSRLQTLVFAMRHGVVQIG